MKGILPLWRKIVDKGRQRLFPLRPARILVLLGLALGSYYFITHDPLYQRPAVPGATPCSGCPPSCGGTPGGLQHPARFRG